jgi:methyltransferase
MSPVAVVVALVAAQRLGELVHAARNTRALLRRGAVESGRGHYPLFVLLHAAWLAALLLFVPADAPPSLPLLAVFVMLQGLRLWVVLSLGPWWTTRVVSLPGAPLVRRGPYRWLRHPNYVVVAAEIAVLPLAFGAWRLALVFSLLNAALLAWRIAVEEKALAGRRAVGPHPNPPPLAGEGMGGG